METIYGFATVPLILGLVEIGKRLGLAAQYAPLLSLALGITFGLLASGLSVESVVAGIVLGLSASGLWSGTKAVLGK